jgi:hypothetical protein
MTPSDIATLLQRQLEQHGYMLTAEELRDVAATLVMAIAEADIEALPVATWRPADGEVRS